jgi:hypothetical protein
MSTLGKAKKELARLSPASWWDKLFHDKIEETQKLARQAARAHGLLPDFV